MITLKIKTSFDSSVSNYVGHEIKIPDGLAKKLHIESGECGICMKTAERFKILYRGGVLWLDKDKVEVE